MILSNKRILEEMEKGNVVISTFKESNLSTSSYDVSLGEYFYREQKNDSKTYNIYSKENRNNVWGNVQQADTAKDVFESYNEDFENISPEDKIILIHPGETILAHTEEFIGGKKNITTMMKSRSSMGRNFINACKCAGWGDVGYINRWTLEITNFSKYYTIPLVVGRRIAQIVFLETGEVNGSYEKKGKYQGSDDIKKLKEEWKPELMLPNLHKDR